MALRFTFAGALFAAVLLVPAEADMGQIHVSLEGAKVGESAQKAVILHNGKAEVLILGTELHADKKTVVVRFIPFPAEPEAMLAPAGVFDRLGRLLGKYRLQYVFTMHSKGGPPQQKFSGVEVTHSERLGAHDMTVFRVHDAAKFRAWVSAYFRKKNLPALRHYDVAEKIVSQYVARGIDWFVLDAVELGPETRFVDPVAYRFQSASLYYPLLTSNSFGGTGEIELFVVAPTTLCAPGSNIFMEEGDKAIDAAGLSGGECLGMANLKASTSAQLVPAEHDLEAIWPEAPAFFAGKPVFLQAMRYSGVYRFDKDVMLPMPAGVAKALNAPEPSEGNPWNMGAMLAPQEQAACRKVPDRGPCKGLFEKFTFDRQTRSCKSFIWGGCQGEVPFETREDCEKTCLPGK